MKPELKEAYYPSGKIETQQWFLNNKLHNENGPACIWHYESGKIEYQWWFLDGKEYIEEEWKKECIIRTLAGIK